MKKFLTFNIAALAFFAAEAITLDWPVEIGDTRAASFAAYHGETVTFAPAFRDHGAAVTNVETAAIYYQTNGMAGAWWRIDNLTFHPTNDIGAAAYRFFISAADPDGKIYRANGTLRMLESPGFTPSQIQFPVQTLDFDTIEVYNAPWLSPEEVEQTLTAEISSATTSVLSQTKPKQAAVASPAAEAAEACQFIDTITQDADGVIAATKKTMRKATTSAPGMVQLDDNTNSTRTDHAATANAVRRVAEDVAGAIAQIAQKAGLSDLANYVPITRKVNNKALSGDITLSASDVGAATTNDIATATDAVFEQVYTKGEVDNAIAGATPGDYDTVKAQVAAVSNKVEALETWAIGEETQMRVENAGETNAVMSVLYTNKVMYSSAQEHTNTCNRAKGYTDAAIVDALDIVDATKADKDWGNHSSSGGPTPEDTLTVEKRKITLTGGGNFSWLESSTGGYWVMSMSLGSTWTLESLADAQNPTNAATITLFDAESHAVQTVTSTSSREVYAVKDEQLISFATVGANDVITITYPVVADSPPTLLYNPVCEAGLENYTTYENWPQYISSVTYSGQSGAWVATVTMNGAPGHGFFRAKYLKAGYTYTKFNQPLGLSQVTIGVKTYNVSVETINGKNLMVLTEAD